VFRLAVLDAPALDSAALTAASNLSLALLPDGARR
jgi:hypothetical protein